MWREAGKPSALQDFGTDKPHTLQGLRTGEATLTSDARKPMEKPEEQCEPRGISENNRAISLRFMEADSWV